MAAGNHSGYADLKSYDSESDIESFKAEFIRSRDSTGGMGTTNLPTEIQSRNLKPKDKVCLDVDEKEVANGRCSPTSRSDHFFSSVDVVEGIQACGTDREPGELSSESGSEDVIESEKKNACELIKVEEISSHAPPERKRKFSPIVWDRDDKDVSSSARTKTRPLDDKTLTPAMLKSCLTSTVSDTGAQKSPVEEFLNQNLNSSIRLEDVSGKEIAEDLTFDSSADLTFRPDEEAFRDYQDVERMVDDDYLPTRNISSSRWIAGSNSPVDEGEFYYDRESPRRNNSIGYSEPLSPRSGYKSSTPDVDLNGESSARGRGKLSEPDELGACSKSMSEGDYSGNGSDEDNDMDVDKGLNNSDAVDESDCENTAQRGCEDACIPQRNVNMLLGCRSVDEFERLNKIDEGTYGVVYRAKDKKTGEIVALKKVKMEKEREGFPLTSLREINILLSFHHPSIVDVKEVVVGSNLDSIFMVMEYMEHDLKALMESMKQPFSQSEVKCLMLQLLSGVKYLHDNWVLHRDLKTSNLLLNNRGELKICDFGLSRQYGSPLKPYTHLVVTLWYRAPELLLGTKQYSTAIDMWSLGCIMAELLSKEPLFNGKTELDQLDKIFRILGTPNETIWPGFTKLPGVKINFVKHQYNLLRKKFPPTSFTGSPVLSDSGFDLLNRLLAYDPERRITAEAALNHEWFREVPLPKVKEFMPTFPAQHAQDRRLRRVMKSPDPLEEQRLKELRGEFGSGGLFG